MFLLTQAVHAPAQISAAGFDSAADANANPWAGDSAHVPAPAAVSGDGSASSADTAPRRRSTEGVLPAEEEELPFEFAPNAPDEERRFLEDEEGEPSELDGRYHDRGFARPARAARNRRMTSDGNMRSAQPKATTAAGRK